ncbi:MAG: alpha/beta fold hydrolase [Candidatus Nanoarchaeia archaeon]
MKKRVGLSATQKILIVLGVVILVAILLASGTKLYLFINLLLGNDVIVRLSVEKDHIEMQRGQEEKVRFKTSVSTNPFCSATCTLKFVNIGTGEIIEEEEFTIRPGMPLEKTYTITAPEYGEGQMLYRFGTECFSQSTTLCHTSGKRTARHILITVDYTLNEQEKQTKEEIKQQLEERTQKIEILKQKEQDMQLTLTKINQKIHADQLNAELESIKMEIEKQTNDLFSLKDAWLVQNFKLIKEKMSKLDQEIATTESKEDVLNQSIGEYIVRYNNITDQLNEIRMIIVNINPSLTEQTLNETIDEFNSITEMLKHKVDIDVIETSINEIRAKTENLSSVSSRKVMLQKEIEHSIETELLCAINRMCLEHISIPTLAEQTSLDYAKSCEKITNINKLYGKIKTQVEEEYAQQNYPNTLEFSTYITNEVSNMEQAIINGYLAELPEGKTNSIIIEEILFEMQKNKIEQTNSYTEFNLTPALTLELINKKPEECQNITIIKNISDVDIEKLQYQTADKFTFSIIFGEPQPICCYQGICKTCCQDEQCKKNPRTYPIIMLHGHAFNKGLAADYGLDGYNKLVNELDKEGYLHAGILTLYTKKNEQGEWGKVGVPITVKGSYYFDVYQSADNPVEIQTKSENIDTYAIRLKEMIDILKYKTDKPKVVLIGYSMGGLVVRRYIQIFGEENVEKIILIGTPNHGVTNKVAELCPVIGESLECRDLKADSLFLNKLNSQELPKIPIYNIVGTGCDMDGEQGDGIVTEKSATLEGAKNYFVNGTCGALEFMHTELYDVDKYPETYRIIKEALQN